MEIGASFGLWMKRRRKALDLTQNALAQEVGCSTATIEKIEADERRPSVQMAALLAEALQVPQPEQAAFLEVARGKRFVDSLAGLPFAPEQPRISNLPISATPLVGRQPELAEIARLLSEDDCRLLTLVGPGGIGKTRLALQAATDRQAQFPDGAFFVPLVGVKDPDFIPPAVAESMNLTFSGPSPPLNQVIQFLSERKLLLLLDNYEQLLTSVDLVRAILSQACDVKLLITSREPLGVQGEWLLEVHGLPVPRSAAGDVESNSAVTLFIQSVIRAGLNRPLGQDELSSVVEICRLVGGMPLGIELAATWSRVLSFQEIASEIQRNMDFLSVTMAGVPERHRSLRAVFDHSWKLLSSDEQQALRRLSVFRGGFTRPAAEFVSGASLSLLGSLVTKSLISVTGGERYELHEAVRQFAAVHLVESPEYDQIRQQHCDYYLTYLGNQEQALKSAAQRQVIRQLIGEYDNIREAWSWAVKHENFALIHHTLRCLGWFCDIIGWLQEVIDQLEPVVQILRAKAAEIQPYQATLGVALAQQGLLYFRQGNFDQALVRYEESLTWLRPLGDAELLTDSLIWSGIILKLIGDIEQSQTNLAEGLACAKSVDDRWSFAYAHYNQGYIASLRGDYEGGYHKMLEGLALLRQQGDPSLLALALNFITPTAVLLGHLDQAEAFLDESLAWTSGIGDRWGEGTAYRNLGQVALARGDLEEARSHLQKSLAIFSQVTIGWDIVLASDYLGRVTLAEGDVFGAESIFLEALQLALEVRTTPLATAILVSLARIQLQIQNFEQALLLSQFAMTHPASTQETIDAANDVTSDAAAHLPAPEIQIQRERAAQLDLESLSEFIFSGQISNDRLGFRSIN